MKTILLPSKIDYKLGVSLAQLLDLLEEINKYCDEPDDGGLVIDMTPCAFLTPLIATPLAALQNKFIAQGKNVTIHCPFGSYLSTYSNTINFPSGFLPELVQNGDYEKALKSYDNKTYVPILNFPAKKSNETNPIRESILQALNNLLYKQLSLDNNFRDGVSYLITEIVNNISDHSAAHRGFIFAQYYPYSRNLDICIADNGLGILGSYRKHGINNFVTHGQALDGAVKGISSKNEAGGRGFGIYTSLKMLVQGMGGNFLLISGNANLIRTPALNDINNVPDSMRWGGTIVALRIPFTRKTFNHIEYLE
jgi:hypothetical protein